MGCSFVGWFAELFSFTILHHDSNGIWTALFVGIFSLIGFWLLLAFVARLWRRANMETAVVVRDSNTGHHWLAVEAFDYGHYCNVCAIAAFHGAQCDCCGVVVDECCLRKADQQLPCKAVSLLSVLHGKEKDNHPPPATDVNSDSDTISLPADRLERRPAKHHWLKGNLSYQSVCTVCNKSCGEGPGLCDSQCVWCMRCAHTNCRGRLSSPCDFGKLKQLIVPPNCVKLRSIGWKGRKQLQLHRVLVPEVENWTPLVVFANRLSGNGEGDLALQSFRRVLNPSQVIDLSKMRPQAGLRWCTLLAQSGVKCKLLVCGGDGTVGWVLSAVEDMQLEPKPVLGLLPLGTGNDLSRALGWGSGHTGTIEPVKFLTSLMEKAVEVRLDRWNILVQHRRIFGYRKKNVQLQMSNYFSIGVDAAVTLNFHNRRSTLPRAMSSRFMNKLLFLTYGTKDVLERACRNLEKSIEIYMDDKLVLLPELEGIVLLNIPFWGAGVTPWSLGCLGKAPRELPPKQKISDGKMEMIGLYSSLHIARMQVGLSEPYRIGQCESVKIRIFGRTLPVQCDGEPWRQSPCEITITAKGQAEVLAHRNAPILSCAVWGDEEKESAQCSDESLSSADTTNRSSKSSSDEENSQEAVNFF